MIELSLDSAPSDSTLVKLRDDDFIMDAADNINEEFADDDKPKRVDTGNLGHQTLADSKVMGGKKPAILLTGATHARELISTSLATYEMLKMIGLGYVRKEPKYE